jgi:hypothetical protein
MAEFSLTIEREAQSIDVKPERCISVPRFEVGFLGFLTTWGVGLKVMAYKNEDLERDWSLFDPFMVSGG